eukprot:865412-Amphidinium_carterae.1
MSVRAFPHHCKALRVQTLPCLHQTLSTAVDLALPDPLLFLQSFARVGFVPFALSLAHVDSPALARSFGCPGSAVLACSAVALGSLPLVLDCSALGASPLLHSLACCDPATLALDFLSLES